MVVQRGAEPSRRTVGARGTGTGMAVGGSGGASTGVGGAGAMGGGELDCDPLFTESFGSLAAWGKLGGGDTTIVGGEAVANPGGDFAAIYTFAAYDLTACGAQVHVVDVNATSGSYTWFGAAVENNPSDRIELAIVGGELQMFYVDGDVSQLVHNAPYSHASQSWLRMRRDPPNLRVETAPAAAGPWTLFHSQAAPAFIDSKFNFTLGVTNVGSTATAAFDDVAVRNPAP